MTAADKVGIMIQVEPPYGFGEEEWIDIRKAAGVIRPGDLLRRTRNCLTNGCRLPALYAAVAATLRPGWAV